MTSEICTVIPNADRISAKLTAKFCALGQLGTYQVDQFGSFREDHPSMHAPCRGFIHRLRKSSILFEDDVVRKLVNEAANVFLTLQETIKSKTETPDFVKTSRQYRCVVRACVMELQEIADHPNTKETRKEIALQNRTIFYGIELIYHLCEILCIDVGAGSVLLPKLLDWLCFHFPIRQQAQEVLDANLQNPDTPIECHPQFWSSVKGLVLRGRCKEARDLLGRHSKIKKSPAITSLRQLLGSFPYIEDQGGNTMVVQFSIRWAAWQKEVLSQLESGTFSTNPHLQQIAEVLAAQEKGLAMIHEHSETWYQFLISYVLFWQPTLQAFQLGEFAQKCKRWFGGEENRALDNILMALFESDLLQVLKLLQEFSESGWAAVHLTDLLCHTGNLSDLDSHDHNVAQSLREDLVLQYGCLLTSHHSLWIQGIRYLDCCPRQGKAHLELILPTLMYGSEKRILRVMHEAERRNMKHVAQVMCSVQGRAALTSKRLGTALTWALRAQDVALCSAVADAILRAYVLDGNFMITDLLDSLGTAMLTSDRLAFLGKYREFHISYRDRRFKDAALILMGLATSGYAPPFFLPVLLTDSLPLMNQDSSVFSSTDVYRLLAALEELKSLVGTTTNQDIKDAVEKLGDNEQLIRASFAETLARAEISEICAN